MLVGCASCNKTMNKIHFSKTQLRLKNKFGYPRCKECIGNIQDKVSDRDVSDEGVFDRDVSDEEMPDELIETECHNPLPPRRLVMTHMSQCDFCEKIVDHATNMCFIDFYFCPHTGWQYCKKCEQRCNKNLTFFSISKESLLEMFSDGEFKVVRSNNDVETGWYIVSNAFRYNISHDYVVTIHNTKQTETETETKTLKKSIYFEDLKSWQL